MPDFNQIVTFIVENKETLASVIVAIFTLVQAIKAKLQAREALMLVVNTLKDEDKLTPAGQFKAETIDKIEKVATIAKVSTGAVESVKQVINDVNRGGLKLGSYKGKPVYLEDVGRVGSQLGAALQVLRGVLRR